MARTRSFDEDEVLDRAMALFWRKGFEATSIEELVSVSGINRASMYAVFGDKRRLFLAVLDHYLARVNAERLVTTSSCFGTLKQPSKCQSTRAASPRLSGARPMTNSVP